jgi:branched-chain amino acid transport system ATP-binding protein
MLELRDLTGGWGPTTIVEDMSMCVKPGETVAIIGRNGVGKSTLLELIVNRARCTSGAIILDGQDLAGLSTYRRARMGVGYVPQQREVFASLTVAEHLAISQRPGQWSRDSVLAQFPSLGRRLESRGNQLSGGEQQMLAIARALLGNPSVLLLDEPSEGLAPVIVEKLVSTIKSLAANGSMAILLVEQRIDVALDLSDRYIIMDRGRNVQEGATTELRKNLDQLPAMMGLQECAS